MDSNFISGSCLILKPLVLRAFAWALSSFAPMLAGLAVLFVLFELKTPGVGLFAMLGAVCGALFLLSQYYLDLANNLEVVLFVAGLALVAIEALTLVGGGLLAVLGALIAFAGLVLTFVPDEYEFNGERFREALSDAAWSGLISVAVVAVGITLFFALVPRSRFGRSLAVQAEITATSVGALERQAAGLAGRRGTAREALHPGGAVVVDGREYSARAGHGAFVEAGSRVEVLGVQFGELVVRPVAPQAGPETGPERSA